MAFEFEFAFHALNDWGMVEIERVAEHVSFDAWRHFDRGIALYGVVVGIGRGRIRHDGLHFVDRRRFVVYPRWHSGIDGIKLRLSRLAFGTRYVIDDRRILPRDGSGFFLNTHARASSAQSASERIVDGRGDGFGFVVALVFEHDFVIGGVEHTADDSRRDVEPAFVFRRSRFFCNPRKERIEAFVEVDVAK